MTSAFRDLDEFLTTPPIELPIGGRLYEFPGSISARSGLMLQRILSAAEEASEGIRDGSVRAADLAEQVLLDDDTEHDLRAEIMGDGEQQMAADGLTTAHTTHVFNTLLVWHTAGPEAAQAAWEHMGEAQAPNRAARRQASKAAATSTRSPASTSGTSTGARTAAATSPRGARSSGTGR